MGLGSKGAIENQIILPVVGVGTVKIVSVFLFKEVKSDLTYISN